MEKPVCKLTGENGNVFNLIGITRNCLRNLGMKEQAEEMQKRVLSSKSYEEALCIISEYVEVV